MKETYYFSHDFNVRCDEKIRSLIAKFGFEGYGIFWALVEDLYQNANAMRTDYERIAYELRTDAGKVKSIVEDFGLFISKNGFFSSNSVSNRLQEIKQKSKKARNSAISRWKNANAMRTQCERNAIKEINTYSDSALKPIATKTKTLKTRGELWSEQVFGKKQ